MPAVTTTFFLSWPANLSEILLTSVSSLWPGKVKLDEVALHFFGFLRLCLGTAIPTAPIWGRVPPQTETRMSWPTSCTKPQVLNRPLEASTENLFMDSVLILESRGGFVNFDLSSFDRFRLGTN